MTARFLQPLLTLLAAATLLVFAAPSAAQSLVVSFSGSVSMCSDPSKNQTIDVSFATSGQSSGSDTIINVSLGGSLGSFPITIPTSELDALRSAVSDAGGSIVFSFGPEPLDPDSLPGCDIQGTITITLGAGDALQATTGAVVDGFLRNALPAISNRIRSVFRGEGTGLLADGNGLTVSGLAAGSDGGPAIGAWAGYSYTDSKGDFAPTAFKSDAHTALFGLDLMPAENWLLGVSVAIENTSVDTRFNGGEQDITAITLAPYIGVLLTDWLSLDATAGVGSVSTDQSRRAGAVQVTGDRDSLRLFGSINATATRSFGSLLASGRAGMLYATQDDDAFTESDGTVNSDARYSVGRFLLGGELAYSAGAWEPYAGATFGYDFTRTSVLQGENDDTDWLFALGLRYFGDNDLSGAIEYSTLLDRNDLSAHSINANLRWTF